MIRRARVPDLSQCDFGATGAATCSRGRTLGGGLGVPAIRLGWPIAVVIGLQLSPDEQKRFPQLCQNHYTLLWIILGSTILAGPSEGVEQTMLELQSTLTEALCCSFDRQQALLYVLVFSVQGYCSSLFWDFLMLGTCEDICECIENSRTCQLPTQNRWASSRNFGDSMGFLYPLAPRGGFVWYPGRNAAISSRGRWCGILYGGKWRLKMVGTCWNWKFFVLGVEFSSMGRFCAWSFLVGNSSGGRWWLLARRPQASKRPRSRREMGCREELHCILWLDGKPSFVNGNHILKLYLFYCSAVLKWPYIIPKFSLLYLWMGNLITITGWRGVTGSSDLDKGWNQLGGEVMEELICPHGMFT